MKSLPFILLMFVVASHDSHAQDTTLQDESIKALIESRRYVFMAESANPLRGRTIYLSPGYTLTVSPDTIESNLPYYGRAYQAPMNPSEAGIKFTSTDFTYTATERKKEKWEISIKTKDGNTTQINLSVFSNGTASLRVTSVDRQSISFQGYIRKQANK